LLRTAAASEGSREGPLMEGKEGIAGRDARSPGGRPSSEARVGSLSPLCMRAARALHSSHPQGSREGRSREGIAGRASMHAERLGQERCGSEGFTPTAGLALPPPRMKAGSLKVSIRV